MPIDCNLGSDGILTMTYRGEFTSSEFDEALGCAVRELERARAGSRKLGLISIAAADTSMNSKMRSRSANWLKENAELMRAACVGHAVVVSNPIQRGVLTAILWLGDYAIPIRPSATDGDARTWLRRRLQTSDALHAHR